MVLLADAGILSFNTTLVIQLLVFVVTAVILWRVALGPISRLMEAREKKIEAGVRAAEEAEKRLVAVQSDVHQLLEAARAQAREIVDRAHREATTEANATRARAREESLSQFARAAADIAAERDRATNQVRMRASDLIVTATEHLLQGALDENMHRRLVGESVNYIATHNGGDS